MVAALYDDTSQGGSVPHKVESAPASYGTAVYLSAMTPRWTPTTEADLREALAAGLLEETHYLELKSEVPPGKGSNKELARDLAQFAVDGGTLIVGVEEHDDAPPTLAPVALAGLPERIEQVARSIPDPPLAVSCQPIPSDADPALGYVLVSVGASGTAPHMVDGTYFGRGDKTKIRLSDPEVVRHHRARKDAEETISGLLEAYIRRDPVPAELRAQAHFFVVASPVAPRREMLLDVVDGDDWAERFMRLRNKGVWPVVDGQFAPNLADAEIFARRTGGAAMTTSGLTRDRQITPPRGGAPFNEDALELEMSEDGEVRLLMTRFSDVLGSGSSEQVLMLDVAPVLTLQVVRIASAVADHCGYFGPWMLGVAATGIAGLTATNGRQLGQDVEEYRMVTTASTEELAQFPGFVTTRLTGRLLRALGATDRYRDLLVDPAP